MYLEPASKVGVAGGLLHLPCGTSRVIQPQVYIYIRWWKCTWNQPPRLVWQGVCFIFLVVQVGLYNRRYIYISGGGTYLEPTTKVGVAGGLLHPPGGPAAGLLRDPAVGIQCQAAQHNTSINIRWWKIACQAQYCACFEIADFLEIYFSMEK